jgi:predicted transcriptional regulator
MLRENEKLNMESIMGKSSKKILKKEVGRGSETLEKERHEQQSVEAAKNNDRARALVEFDSECSNVATEEENFEKQLQALQSSLHQLDEAMNAEIQRRKAWPCELP